MRRAMAEELAAELERMAKKIRVMLALGEPKIRVPGDALVLFICDHCVYPFAVRGDELKDTALASTCTRCSKPMRLVSVAEAE